jgi:type I restriction enzyme, S subunit
MSQTALLGDLIDDIAMGPFGSNLKVDNFIESGVPVVKGGNLYEREVGGAFSFVSEEKAQSLKRSLAFPNDIVITHRGTLGQISIVPDGKYPYYLVSQSQLRLTPNTKKVNPLYLLYYLRSPLGQHELMQHTSQVGVPSISTPTTAVKSFKILLPDLMEQQRIVDILGTLDEKIELNRRTNETLEQLGQALFKHYFIDNPEANTWGNSTIGAECDVLLGGTPSRVKPEYWVNGTIGWINSGKVNEFRITSPSELITEDALRNSAAKLLPRGTTVIAITGATLGQVSRLEKPFAANQSVIGIVGNNKIPNEYIYLWINRNIERIIGQQTGGAQQHINRNNVANFDLLIPPAAVLNQFQSGIEPVMNKIASNCFETESLIELRNALLSRLISGQIQA